MNLLQHKTDEALSLLKDAICEVIANGDPRGVYPNQVRDEIGLAGPDNPFAGVIYAVITAMTLSGELEKSDDVPARYTVMRHH